MLAESQDLGYFLYFLNFIFILVGDLGGGGAREEYVVSNFNHYYTY